MLRNLLFLSFPYLPSTFLLETSTCWIGWLDRKEVWNRASCKSRISSSSLRFFCHQGSLVTSDPFLRSGIGNLSLQRQGLPRGVKKFTSTFLQEFWCEFGDWYMYMLLAWNMYIQYQTCLVSCYNRVHRMAVLPFHEVHIPVFVMSTALNMGIWNTTFISLIFKKGIRG